MRTGVVTACCGSHQAVGCCDPEDCGPCCPECPSCPTLASTPPYERKIFRAVMERNERVVWAALMFGQCVAASLQRYDLPVPQLPVVPPVGLDSLISGTPLPWVGREA